MRFYLESDLKPRKNELRNKKTSLSEGLRKCVYYKLTVVIFALTLIVKKKLLKFVIEHQSRQKIVVAVEFYKEKNF
jgi:hypothetical protein